MNNVTSAGASLLYLLHSGPHSEFTSGRCFHIQWGAGPSGSGVSTRVIGTLDSCCQGIGLRSTGSTGDPDEGDMNSIRVYVCWLWAHLHGLVHMCVYFFMLVCAHIEEGLLFRAAGWQTDRQTDSLLVNEQLSAITIHEPCHSPPLSKLQHLKPLVSH